VTWQRHQNSIRWLHEEERGLATRAPHFFGVFGVVSSYTVNTVNWKNRV
jgi:hypothetical protein